MRMPAQRFLLISCLLVLHLTGCTAAFTVKSDPLQADVYVQDAKSGEKKPLGKTPLELPLSAVKQTAGEDVQAGDYVTIDVEKQGYVSEHVAIPMSRFGTLVTALNVKLKPGDNPKEMHVAKDILDHLFLAQRFAVNREYERAQAELDRILTDFPDFPRALSMRGSIYYMQKNYAESAKWYERAAKADPQMEDAVKMLAKIRTLEGGSKP